MNENTQNNKKMTVFIVIAVAVIVLAAAGIIVVKYIRRATKDTSANVTLLKCNTGKTLSDTDLKEIEDAIKGIVGNKLIKTEKTAGVLPVTGFPTDEESGKELISDVGDGLSITFKLLELAEQEDVLTVIANKCDFIHQYGMEFEKTVYQMTFADIYRADIK